MASTTTSRGSVQLAGERSASEIFHSVLEDTAAAFPSLRAPDSLAPTAKAFRSSYPRLLPQFEALRLAGERVAIARAMAASMQRRIVWQDDEGAMPLVEMLRSKPGNPLELACEEPNRAPEWRPSLVYGGVIHDAGRLAPFGDALAQRHILTPRAAGSLRWVSEHALEDGAVRLTGRRIVVLGAAAEMASSAQLIAAGADLLWLDVAPPPPGFLASAPRGGRLYWPKEGADLLRQPADVLATIVAFADGRPVDLCLYAYAPGQARELRLTGSMNAMVDAIPHGLIASVMLLVSPTTPTALDEDDIAAMDRRYRSRRVWERALTGLRILDAGGQGSAPRAVTRSVVGIQGASYQAAQYLGKMIAAECWANHGVPDASNPSPLRVSANTAAITRTRSLRHPVFDAAFNGAHAMGVETFEPALSRELNGLLAVRDWLDTETPVPGRVRVHGGIHTLPYSLESALRVAAVIGFVGRMGGRVRSSR